MLSFPFEWSATVLNAQHVRKYDQGKRGTNLPKGMNGMLWRLVRKIARFYALIAMAVLGLMLASDKISSHQLNTNEALLAAFFPYGVLAGLIISWITMRAGGWITALSLGGFYLASFWQSGAWPQDDLPWLIAGSAPLFLLASYLKSMGQPKRKKK